jgi:hypothetical protein
MPAPRLTRAALLIENQHLRERLAAMTPPSYSREIENLKAKLAALSQPQPEPYVALKSVDRHGYHETTLLRWCERGLIDSKREGSRWFCRQGSVNAWIKRLAGG